MLFARYGVLPACICDNAKEMVQGKFIFNNANEMVQGKFYQKLKDAACHLKLLELYTHWSNNAEREIKELEKGAGHKLSQSRAPKHLWDDCLELEAYIRSKMAHEIYKLDGEYPKQ